MSKHGSSDSARDARTAAVLRATIAQAWHDVTCPEGEDCRDRVLHSASQALASSGVLQAFLERLDQLTHRHFSLPDTQPAVAVQPRVEPITTPLRQTIIR